jgi:NADH-quinone oxidoreductase subunit B
MSSEMEKHQYDPHAMSNDDILTTRLEKLVEFFRVHGVNWARKNSLWPLPFATACCGIELMATGASRYDIARFGAEAMRFSPRQSDLLICAGRVAIKMMPVLQRLYKQMCEPKWVISMGACASSGGVFDTYAVVQGIDQFLPVDVYVPGCPPRPETLIEGIMAIQRLIEQEGVKGSAERGKGLRLTVAQPPSAVVALTVAGEKSEAKQQPVG